MMHVDEVMNAVYAKVSDTALYINDFINSGEVRCGKRHS